MFILNINAAYGYSGKTASKQQPRILSQPQGHSQPTESFPGAIKMPDGKILVDKKDFEELKDEVNEAIKKSVKYFEEEIILDDKFMNKVQNGYRQKLDKIRSELEFYSSDLLNNVNGLIINQNSHLFSELANLNGANYQCIMSIWAATYAYDLTSLFALSNSQYSIYPQLKPRLEYSLKTLNESAENLSKIAAQSKNTAFQKTFLSIGNKIREAKEIIEKIKTEIDARYEAAKKIRSLKK